MLGGTILAFLHNWGGFQLLLKKSLGETIYLHRPAHFALLAILLARLI
jgi:hypothetical protein